MEYIVTLENWVNDKTANGLSEIQLNEAIRGVIRLARNRSSDCDRLEAEVTHLKKCIKEEEDIRANLEDGIELETAEVEHLTQSRCRDCEEWSLKPGVLRMGDCWKNKEQTMDGPGNSWVPQRRDADSQCRHFKEKGKDNNNR